MLSEPHVCHVLLCLANALPLISDQQSQFPHTVVLHLKSK